MKNIILISCILVLIPLKSMQAQSGGDEKIRFGLKGGLNLSNVWDEKGQDFSADPKLGLAGGGFLGIPIGKYLGFQPEVLISQKGMQANGTLLGSGYSFKKTTTHLDIPLQLQVKPVPQLTFLGGVVYSYLMYEKTTYQFGATQSVQETEFENDNIRKNHMGVIAGADINITRLVISGRVAWDFLTNHGDGSSSTPRYRNQWIQLTVGFRI